MQEMHSKRIEVAQEIGGRKVTLVCKHYPGTREVDILGWVPVGEELSYEDSVKLDREIKKQRRTLELDILDTLTP